MRVRSEWIHGRLSPDRDPLPLGKLFPVGGTADARSITGRTHAAKWIDNVIIDSLIVDVQQSGAKPIANP